MKILDSLAWSIWPGIWLILAFGIWISLVAFVIGWSMMQIMGV